MERTIIIAASLGAFLLAAPVAGAKNVDLCAKPKNKYHKARCYCNKSYTKGTKKRKGCHVGVTNGVRVYCTRTHPTSKEQTHTSRRAHCLCNTFVTKKNRKACHMRASAAHRTFCKGLHKTAKARKACFCNGYAIEAHRTHCLKKK